jgi:uncharacterized protein (TIRG00374 family)
MVRKFIIFFIKIGFSLSILWYLASSGKIDFSALLQVLHPPFLLSIIGLSILNLFLASERWRILLCQQTFMVSRGRAFLMSTVGIFFSFVLPGGVGGDIVKSFVVAKAHPENKMKVVLTVLADRVIGLFSVSTVALLAFAFEIQLLRKEPLIFWIFLMILLTWFTFIMSFFILFSSHLSTLRVKVHQALSFSMKLQSLWRHFQSYRLSFKELVKLCLASLGSQLIAIAIIYLAAIEFKNEAPDFYIFMFAVPVGFMVTAIPISPGGVGVSQAAFYFLFSKATGEPTDTGALGLTLLQCCQFLIGFIGFLIFSIAKKSNPAPNDSN